MKDYFEKIKESGERPMIQSVDRALEILIYLHEAGKETGITQIANDLNIYKSTVHRTLSTLENRGFVTKNSETDKYWLGSRLFTLGKSVEMNMGMLGIIRPYARKLKDEFKEVVNVSILERNIGDVYRSVIILKEQSEGKILTANPPVGSRNFCHCSSVGKCLLAFGEDIDLSLYEKGIQKYTSKTIATVDELKKALEDVRRKGYAIDDQELEDGFSCIGAPILDNRGYAIAAISLSGPSSRIMNGDVDKHIEGVKEIARQISLSLS